MTRDAYLSLLKDILSGDPQRVRSANVDLFTHAVVGIEPAKLTKDALKQATREADLTLAEVG